MSFFKNKTTKKHLSSFLTNTKFLKLDDSTETLMLTVTKEIISSMLAAPEPWDEKCTFNTLHISESFTIYLADFDESNTTSLKNIFTLAYRFLCEFDFMVGSGKELGYDLQKTKSSVQDNLNLFDDKVKSSIVYAQFSMPVQIAKFYINHEKFGTIVEYNNKIDEAEELKIKWDREILEKEKTVNTLKSKLEEYETGFNFVGLYKGFDEIAKAKTSELLILFISLLSVSVLILTPLVIEFILALIKTKSEEAVSLSDFYVLAAVIPLEIILIYFFRVILYNHKSVKAQLLQIELRKTLCQFIQSYAEYSGDIKEKNSASLEKFENLIFSGIISDSENLPTTYDGIEQIGKMISAAKK